MPPTSNQLIEEATDGRPEKKGQQDRSKLNLHEEHEVKYWTKQLGVDNAQLQKLVDKVGNSAAAVRKEFGK